MSHKIDGSNDVIHVDGFNPITGNQYMVHLTNSPEQFAEMVEKMGGERYHIHVNCPVEALNPKGKTFIGRVGIVKLPDNVSSCSEVYAFLRPAHFEPIRVEDVLIAKTSRHECLAGIPWTEIIRVTTSGKMTAERQLIPYLPDPPKVIVIAKS